MSDDARYERLLIEALGGAVPSRAPAELRFTIKSSTSRVRPRPLWLAVLKEPPMRISSTVVVGSPTARTALILAATLLVAVLATGAVVGAATLLEEPDSTPIIVAQDGSGDFTTLGEAVAAAHDGDIIRVRPGTYPGSVVVDKDIIIRGQGGRDEITIEIAPEGPIVAGAPFGIHLLDTQAVVANLTIRGPEVAIGIAIEGGAPTLQGLDIVLAGNFTGQPRDAFRYFGRAGGTMTDVTTDGFARILQGSSPTIERLDHTKEGMWIADAGSDPVIVDSEVSPDIEAGANPTISDSYILGMTITGAGGVIRDNVFASPAFMFGDDYDNSADDIAIDIIGSSPLITTNRIGDHPIGIRISGGAPTIEGNTIENNVVGLAVPFENGMTLAENTFCGNAQDLDIPEGSSITLEGNEVC